MLKLSSYFTQRQMPADQPAVAKVRMDTSKGAALQVVKDGKIVDSLPLSKLLKSKGGSVTFGRGLNR